MRPVHAMAGRGPVVLFGADSNEALHGNMNEWAATYRHASIAMR